MVSIDSPINGLSSGVYENSWRGTPRAVHLKNNENNKKKILHTNIGKIRLCSVRLGATPRDWYHWIGLCELSNFGSGGFPSAK